MDLINSMDLLFSSDGSCIVDQETGECTYQEGICFDFTNKISKKIGYTIVLNNEQKTKDNITDFPYFSPNADEAEINQIKAMYGLN